MTEPTMTALFRLAEANNAEQRLIREDLRRLTGLMSGVTASLIRLSSRIDEVGRQTSAQISDVRDDLALLIKGEIGGQFANLETRLEQGRDREITALAQRVEELEQRL